MDGEAKEWNAVGFLLSIAEVYGTPVLRQIADDNTWICDIWMRKNERISWSGAGKHPYEALSNAIDKVDTKLLFNKEIDSVTPGAI